MKNSILNPLSVGFRSTMPLTDSKITFCWNSLWQYTSMEMSFTSIKLLKYIHGLFKDVNAQKCYLLTAEKRKWRGTPLKRYSAVNSPSGSVITRCCRCATLTIEQHLHGDTAWFWCMWCCTNTVGMVLRCLCGC